ncbi:T9SS type A sorting domain-containing protein [uncultured Flavobacterium sp.]|uniref:T9SS type A sorting domain-containing protein n=1 Tax=uncultured Flavobacterium sp. TaxID=165435 RepID=UPI0025CC965C|nr:T9SS type A sorting domain-containing protein [uncultured Flavobacterium sp.]
MAGWTFHDLNGNGNNWLQGQNIYYNGTSLAYGNSGVLRHSISNVPSGNATGFATENDWAISPEIDLTNASGTITLAAYIGRQRTTHVNVSRVLYIYESTLQKPVPALSDFQALAVDANGNQLENNPYKIVGSSFPADLNQTVESLVDISVFAGKKIYIGLWSNRIASGNALNSQNINIDEMAIYATTLGTNTIEKSKEPTRLLQNPVASELRMQLNPSFSTDFSTVRIYNMLGQEIMALPYASRTNVEDLSSGTYLMTISDGSAVERLKFIKK